MGFFRAAFLVVLGAASLAAVAFLFPWLKEGFGIEELPVFAGVAAALLAGHGCWWLLHRRQRGRLFWVGSVVTTIPLSAYLLLCLRVLVNDWRGRRLAASVRIVSLREEDIRWAGLPEPVGVRIGIDLEHAVGLEGNLFAPKVVMGADPRPTHRDYFFGAMDRGVDPLLEAPVYELGGPPRDVLLRPGQVRVQYDLFPAVLGRREAGALCLMDRAFHPAGARAGLPDGGDLGAAWFFAGGGGVIVDMSAPLTEALRRNSRYQGRREEWHGLVQRLEPDALEAAGFRRCAVPGTGAGEVCYCAAGPDPPAAAP